MNICAVHRCEARGAFTVAIEKRGFRLHVVLCEAHHSEWMAAKRPRLGEPLGDRYELRAEFSSKSVGEALSRIVAHANTLLEGDTEARAFEGDYEWELRPGESPESSG